jgi:hypothetical protein
MNDIDTTVVKVWTLCAVCGIEVPFDEAVVPEVADQLTYLCGLECYARWRAAAALSLSAPVPRRNRH